MSSRPRKGYKSALPIRGYKAKSYGKKPKEGQKKAKKKWLKVIAESIIFMISIIVLYAILAASVMGTFYIIGKTTNAVLGDKGDNIKVVGTTFIIVLLVSITLFVIIFYIYKIIDGIKYAKRKKREEILHTIWAAHC